MAVEVPAVTRRVKRAACHAHCASRARMRTSSPRIARTVTVSVPPAHDRHVRATAALARSIDRARGVALAMAVKEAVEMEGEEAMVQVSMQDFGWDI